METKIFDYGMNGEGVTKIDNKIVLVPFALINESVDIDIVEDKGNFSIARLNKVLTPSPHRTTPVCPYYYECGGCNLQHMDYTEQLKFKSLLVKKTLKKILGVDLAVNDTIACDSQFNYRNKGTFAVKSPHFGYFKHSSNELLDIDSCPIQSTYINEIYSIVRDYLKLHKYAKRVKNIVIRVINEQILVGVVASQDIDISSLYVCINKVYNNIGLYKVINSRRDSVVISGKIEHVAGIKEITLNNHGINYSIDLVAFHQTNIDIQDKLYSRVLDYVDEKSIVLNGFSGAGLLSAILTRKAKQVYGIEIERASHLSAEKLKVSNSIHNLTNICGDFFKKYKEIHTKIDTLILDPSKKGCGKQVMNLIDGVENIIYISCNPIALCKDLREILPHYQVVEITPFDMFPNTLSVETLVILKLKK